MDKEFTVGDCRTNRSENNPNKITKAFMCYPCLLSFEAPEEVRKHKDFVIVNEDKTFSILNEFTFLNDAGVIETARVRGMEKFNTTLMLCRNYFIRPSLLIGIN